MRDEDEYDHLDRMEEAEMAAAGPEWQTGWQPPDRWPPHRINIGDTVDVTTATGTGFTTWRGEVLDFVSAPTLGAARVLCTDDDAHGGMSKGLVRSVSVHQMTRAGDPDGMREDGCDDVDVTGRVRPYHRHAATGEAHAHPSGELAHTHQTPEQWRAMSEAATAAMASKVATSELIHQPDPLVDPVERLAREIATWRYANEGHHRTVTAEDRATAREMLGAVVAEPWHLVRLEPSWDGNDLPEVAEEWSP